MRLSACCPLPGTTPLPCLLAVMTVATLAQEASACVTQPGCGYLLDPASGPAGLVCTIGTYSSGNNQQPCITCPAGLTTSAARQESVSSCMAPSGYFFQVRASLANTRSPWGRAAGRRLSDGNVPQHSMLACAQPTRGR